MTDEQLKLLFIEVAKILNGAPTVNSAQIISQLRAVLKTSSQPTNTINQINLNSEKIFQIFAESGANINLHLDGLNVETVLSYLIEAINTFVQEQKSKHIIVHPNFPRKSTKFVGRQKELKILHQKLQTDKEAIPCAISGMGGVGKTELALQYAHYHWLRGTYAGGICWFQGRDDELGSKILAFVTNSLHLKPPDVPNLPYQVSSCWQKWQEQQNGDILLILDDVNDYPKIEPYLPPQSSRFKVLITTRFKFNKLIEQLPLETLTAEGALDLLRHLIGEEKISQEFTDAKMLCQRLGYLPLALELVGGYIFERRVSIKRMLEKLEKNGLGHESLNGSNNDTNWTYNAKKGVRAAFESSWEILPNKAKELAYLLSLFALAPISWTLVESVDAEQDLDDLEDARWQLERLHLLYDEDYYYLHQLTREFFKEKLKKSKQVEDRLHHSFCLAMIAVVKQKQLPELPTQKDIQIISLDMPHMLEVINSNKIPLINNTVLSSEDFCLFFVNLGRLYTAQCSYKEALICYKNYFSNAQERFGENSLEVASSQNNLASLYEYLGRHDEAVEYYQQALDLTINRLGDNHLNVATIMNNLALVLYNSRARYINEKKARSDTSYYMEPEEEYYYYVESRQLFKKALKIRKFHLGENNPIVAQSLDALGVIHIELGNIAHSYDNMKKAERLLQRAFDIRKDTLPEEHPDIAVSQNNLAYLYQRRCDYSRAEQLFLNALSLNKLLFGEKHMLVAHGLWNLGELYKNKYEEDQAKPLLQLSLNIFKECLGNDHFLVVSASQRIKEWNYEIN
jgi:tetratricopeptide (TPR) repeat protein